MGEWSLHGSFYLPDIGESNANKPTFDGALDTVDGFIQALMGAVSGPNGVLTYHIANAIVGRVVDSSGNKYFSTEKANGGDPAL